MKKLNYLKDFKKFNESISDVMEDYMILEGDKEYKVRVYTLPSNYDGKDYKHDYKHGYEHIIYEDTPKEFDYIFKMVYLDEIDLRSNIEGYYKKEGDFFRQADETEYASDNETIYLPIDEEKEKIAIEENDQDYFYDKNNFKETTPSKEMLEEEEYIEYHDGSNWRIETITDHPVLDRDNRFDGTKMTEIYSTKNGQGQGHDEYYEITDSNNKHIMYAHRPVSYWQGDENDYFYWVNPKYIRDLLEKN